MHTFTHLASLCALLTAVTAIPLKRDLIINTITEVDIVTEYVTATVWVDGDQAASTSATPYSAPAVPTSVAAIQTTTSSVYVAAPAPTSTSIAQVIPVQTSSPEAAPTSSTTSVYVAPAPTTTSVYVAPPAPTTTSIYVAPAAAPTSEAPAPAATSAAVVQSSTGSAKNTGEITYYAVGTGSCGNTNTDSEMVVAVSHLIMNKPSMCGKTVSISYDGTVHTAAVVDTCMSCNSGDLDMSPTLFKAVAPNGDGRVSGVQWWFN